MDVGLFRVTSVVGKSFSFVTNDEFGDSKYILEEAEGFGPPPFNLGLNYGGPDGMAYFNGVSPGAKTIVFQLAFRPNYAAGETVEKLRSDLYSLAVTRPGRSVEIQVRPRSSSEEWPIITVGAYLKSIDFDLSAKTPRVRLTFSCQKAYFEAITDTQLTYSSPYPTSVPLPYLGNAPAGFLISLINITSTPNTSVNFRYGTTQSSLESVYVSGISVAASDLIYIDGRPGLRNIYKKTSLGTVIPMLGYAEVAEWPVLYPGNNSLTTTSPSSWGVSAITYKKAYWGV